MRHRNDLIVTNLLAIMILVAVLLVGWWDAAAFGLAVLLLMDLLVLVRARPRRTPDRLQQHASAPSESNTVRPHEIAEDAVRVDPLSGPDRQN